MSDSPTLLTLIAEGQEYSLHGSEDEMVFLLRCKTDHMAARLCDGDAIRFRADYETTKLQFPKSEPDRILAQLWDQGGYSWLAAEEGD